MSLRATLCAALAALLVVGCASTTSSRDEKMAADLALVQAHAGSPVASAGYISHGTDFEPLGDSHLLLWQSRSRAFLVEVDSICRDLDWTYAIVVNSRSSWLSTGTDSIDVRGQRCYIREIRPVDVAALEQARKQARAAAPTGG